MSPPYRLPPTEGSDRRVRNVRMPLSDDNAMLKQYHRSKASLCSLIAYGIDKGEFKQVNKEAVVDLLLFSYQGVRMLSSIMPLDDDNISKGMIREIRAMLVK